MSLTDPTEIQFDEWIQYWRTYDELPRDYNSAVTPNFGFPCISKKYEWRMIV